MAKENSAFSIQHSALTPRALALQILCRCERGRSYANLALDAALKREALSPADAAMCTALVYGVIERRRTLDYQLENLLTKPLAQLPPDTRAALRLGLYQLFYMERIPAHAAIHESVELVKRSPNARHTAALVNAVLRRAQGQGLRLPDGDDDASLGVRCSCPQWLVGLWRESYPKDYLRLLERSFGSGELVLRVNTLKTNMEDLAQLLGGEEIPWLPGALRMEGGAVASLPGWDDGLFHVQSAAAQLCCMALDPQPGDTVFDLCAAPGGKSFTCAEMMGDRGRVIAMDLHENRVNLIRKGTARLELSCIEAMRGDAREAGEILSNCGKAACVLCDVPCSGLGILGKKPDIREKMHAELDKLPEMQYDILCAGAGCLAEDGVLVYSTCTLNPAENEGVCRRFLQTHPQFKTAPVLPGIPGLRSEEGFLTLMPHISGTNGFFIARFSGGK